MTPEKFTVGDFIQLRDSDAILVRWDVLCYPSVKRWADYRSRNRLRRLPLFSVRTPLKIKDGAIIPMSQALEEGIEWVEEYNGVTESMAATMQYNLNGQLTILKFYLEELAISFGELLMPTIRAVVSKIQVFVAAIGPLLVILGTVITKVGTAMKGFASLSK